MMRALTLIFLAAVWLLGCQPANKPPANESAPSPNTTQKIRVDQTAPESRRTDRNQAVAERMVRIATSFPQVKSATAVVAGRYTIVGIDVDPTLDRGRVGTLKYSVAQALHEDPQGKNALVTADVDLVQRLRELADDMRAGRPAAGIAEELAEIAARIMPQPSKEVPRQEQPPTRLDQERLNQTPNPSPAGKASH
ncbi:sporulation lipoprotein, YhcN/YlaJ family [Planifilum fulgidum]|jgi:YhcN/YlaJ family sporulation lipoprotein|uniref:Sporulation lipoprotein, YhcN/YlaJ family n=1 Tax=Planifilum fulgidum TaxID=201973 RepID=A0A1I2KG67_9BACL|nr:YhcN/YlaJ family sporulation lipoprotein [Planifilum fulgidum]MBO2495639.1 YhcN/YlaJ family sporulation lipoprotein [Bacillota bacterium]MBO2533787.1 YhcN/YlaJ family sporulation lipoprotein [Thermoactinomycetaceae bacterium]SFF66012.1 sporulation lipoprotein, YhcN/YlaJ family [Planifilum fulgidum]